MSPHATTPFKFVWQPLDSDQTAEPSPTTSTLSQVETSSQPPSISDLPTASAAVPGTTLPSHVPSHEDLTQMEDAADQDMERAKQVLSLAMCKKHKVGLQKQVAALEAELDWAQADLDEMSDENDKLAGKVAEMQARIAQLERDLKSQQDRAADLEVDMLGGVSADGNGARNDILWHNPASFVIRHRPDWSYSDACQWVRAQLRTFQVTGDNFDGWTLKTGAKASKWVATEAALQRDLLPMLTLNQKSLNQVRLEAIVSFVLVFIGISWFVGSNSPHST